MTEGEEEVCPICLTRDGRSKEVRLECGHGGHLTCMATWVRVNPSCTLCRRPILNSRNFNKNIIELKAAEVLRNDLVQMERNMIVDGVYSRKYLCCIWLLHRPPLFISIWIISMMIAVVVCTFLGIRIEQALR